MAINWAKVQNAIDLAARANTVRAKIIEATAAGFVTVDDNPDLNIPFNAALQNLYNNKAQSLFDQARTELAGA